MGDDQIEQFRMLVTVATASTQTTFPFLLEDILPSLTVLKKQICGPDNFCVGE